MKQLLFFTFFIFILLTSSVVFADLSDLFPSTSPCWVKGTVSIDGNVTNSDGAVLTATVAGTLQKTTTLDETGVFDFNSLAGNDGNTVLLKVCGLYNSSDTNMQFSFTGFCNTTDAQPWITKTIDFSTKTDGTTGCTCDAVCSGGYCVNPGTTGVCSSNTYYCDSDGTCESAFGETTSTCSADCPSGGGGGGGGGGYYPSSETSAQQSIVAGGSGSFDFTKLYVTEINVTVKNGTAGKFTVTNSTKPSGSPLAIASADGLVYNYFEITSTIPNSNIATATITFKVLKTWISSNNIDPDQVFLKKLVNNEWVELPTIRTGEDASYYYYETTVSSFSSYVIVGHNKKAAPTVTTPAPTHKACSNLKCQATAGAGTDECQADSDCAAATTPPAEKPAAAEEKPPVPEAKKAGPSTALQIVTVIIIFVAVALVILSGVKKKRGRLKPIQEFKG